MTKLRMTVRALRKMVTEMVDLFEAPPRRPIIKTAGTKPLSDPTSGSGRVHSTAVKGSPSYDPLTSPPEGKSPGWLSVYEPNAYRALKDLGSPPGRIFVDKAYIMFRPEDPGAKAIFWAGVPEKKRLEGGAIVTPKEGKAKPHAWRTYEELTTNQRDRLGWVDPRDRGKVKGEDEPPPEKGLDVRVKGVSQYAPQEVVWNEKGELEALPRGIAPEPQMMGSVPGASFEPGRGGGMPSATATQAAARAAAAKGFKLPDWETLSLPKLQQWRDVIMRKSRSSGEAADRRTLQVIDKTIEDRESGKPPKAPPPRARPTEPTTSPKEKWGERKPWGRTSKDVQVTKVERPKK